MPLQHKKKSANVFSVVSVLHIPQIKCRYSATRQAVLPGDRNNVANSATESNIDANGAPDKESEDNAANGAADRVRV